MVKSVKIRGLNAGQAARVLQQQGDAKVTTRAVRDKCYRELKQFRETNCFDIQLPQEEPAGSLHSLLCLDFHTLFLTMSEASSSFRKTLWDASRGHIVPVILYCDEITPGNPLQPDPQRKCWLFYATPACGQASRDELSWGCFAAIRQARVKNTMGGLAEIWRLLLQELMRRNTPKLLSADGQKKLITYEVRLIIADEAALHQLLACKGAAGRKPCFKCNSLVSKACWEQLKDSPVRNSFHPLHHPYLADFAASSVEGIWTAIDQLIMLQNQISKKDFGEYEKNLGWHGCIYSVQQDRALRQKFPPSKYSYDPLHCYFSAGILGIEMALLKDAFHHVGLAWQGIVDSIKAFVAIFHGYHKPNLRAIAENYFGDHQWKANASSQMGLWPFVHLVCLQKLHPDISRKLTLQLKSFQFLCEELKHVAILKHTSSEDGLPTLRQVQANHMQAFYAAYGANALRPKHHYRLHLVPMFTQEKFLYDCITMERKHRAAKAEIQSRLQNLSVLDRTLLVRLHLIQLEEMDGHRLGYRCSSDAEAQWNSMKLRLSQPILLLKSQNLFCPMRWTGIVEGNLYAIGDLYPIVEAESANYVTWRLSAAAIHLALPPAWMLPNYWRRAGSSFITLL